MNLKQIRMRAGAVKNNLTACCINAVDQEPIRINVALPLPFVFSMQRMIIMLWQQGLFVNKQGHYFPKPAHILTAFLHQSELLSVKRCINRFQHGLIIKVFIHKIFPHFIKRAKPLCWYLSSKHSVSFLKGSNGLCIKAQFTGFWVTVFGAQRTLGLRSWCKGKNNLTFRNFFGNFKGNPAVSRYFYSLCNGHVLNVA